MKELDTASQFTVEVDARGRLVLPAAVRRHLSLKGRGEVILTVDKSAVVQLSSRRRLAAKLKGVYKHLSSKGSMVDELIAERRKEGARES